MKLPNLGYRNDLNFIDFSHKIKLAIKNSSVTSHFYTYWAILVPEMYRAVSPVRIDSSGRGKQPLLLWPLGLPDLSFRRGNWPYSLFFT